MATHVDASDARDLNRFADALREFLDLEPLHRTDPLGRPSEHKRPPTDMERFYATHEWLPVGTGSKKKGAP